MNRAPTKQFLIFIWHLFIENTPGGLYRIALFKLLIENKINFLSKSICYLPSAYGIHDRVIYSPIRRVCFFGKFISNYLGIIVMKYYGRNANKYVILYDVYERC